jgi:hypothetical protein
LRALRFCASKLHFKKTVSYLDVHEVEVFSRADPTILLSDTQLIAVAVASKPGTDNKFLQVRQMLLLVIFQE